MRTYKPGNWELHMPEDIGVPPVEQFQYRPGYQADGHGDEDQANGHGDEHQPYGHGDGNHGHAGHGAGNVAATSDRQWTWNTDMECEVLTSRKQFIKLAGKAKEAKTKAKVAWQVAGDAAKEVKEQKEHVKALQTLCEDLGKNIARVDVKADEQIQAGKRVHVKLETQMTEEHLNVQQQLQHLQTQIASSSSSGCFSFMKWVMRCFPPHRCVALGGPPRSSELPLTT